MEYRFKVDVPGYIYPTGRAGKIFAENIKKGVVVASRCDECRVYFLPPTAYCPHCFNELRDYSPVEAFILVAKTVLDRGGEKVAYGYVKGIVGGEETQGGFIHKVDPEAEPGEVLKPVLKPEEERRGIITDIEFFAKSD